MSDQNNPPSLSDDVSVPQYRHAGRPPRSRKHKVSRPIRALVTLGVEQAVNQSATEKDLLLSDFLRLAIYRQLETDGQMTDELRMDATFDTLRKEGFV